MDGGSPAETRLYQHVLGEAFDALPLILRRVHGHENEAVAEGIVRVVRGPGRIRALAADLLRLPRAGECVPLRLEIRAERDRERWIRYFDGRRLETRQWQRKGVLVEAAGPLEFGFRVEADQTGMRFTSLQCRLLFLLLPNAIAPHITAVVVGREAGWSVAVRIEAPLLGLLARYEGEATPLCRPH